MESIETGKVYTFKLNSGEEVIAKVSGIFEQNYVIGDLISYFI